MKKKNLFTFLAVFTQKQGEKFASFQRRKDRYSKFRTLWNFFALICEAQLLFDSRKKKGQWAFFSFTFFFIQCSFHHLVIQKRKSEWREGEKKTETLFIEVPLPWYCRIQSWEWPYWPASKTERDTCRFGEGKKEKKTKLTKRKKERKREKDIDRLWGTFHFVSFGEPSSSWPLRACKDGCRLGKLQWTDAQQWWPFYSRGLGWCLVALLLVSGGFCSAIMAAPKNGNRFK